MEYEDAHRQHHNVICSSRFILVELFSVIPKTHMKHMDYNKMAVLLNAWVGKKLHTFLLAFGLNDWV